jgi:hypothetical protein
VLRQGRGFDSIAGVIRALYFEPDRDSTVERILEPDWGVEELVRTVLDLSSARGHPAAELIRLDGSSLSIGTDGTYAILVWTDTLGDSSHSVGHGATSALVYDYFGSWSENPAEFQVPLTEAVESARQYVRDGSPVTERVLFVPD